MGAVQAAAGGAAARASRALARRLGLGDHLEDVIAACEGRLDGAFRGINLDRKGGIGVAQAPGNRGERHRPFTKGQMIAGIGRRAVIEMEVPDQMLEDIELLRKTGAEESVAGIEIDLDVGILFVEPLANASASLVLALL